MPAGAAAVVRADVPAVRQVGWRLRRLGRSLRGAAIVLGELIAHRSGAGDAEGSVGQTVHLIVGDRLLAVLATAQHGAVVDRDGLEDVRTVAGKRIAHPAAEAKAVSKDVLR